jgi:hypothetical protein
MCKYVVVETGYTSRLCDETFNEWSKDDNVILIKDGLWGDDGEWTFGNGDYTQDEKKEVMRFLEDNNMDGVVVFKVRAPIKFRKDAFDDYVEILESKDYCAFCCVDCIYERKCKGEFAVIRVDCESG